METPHWMSETEAHFQCMNSRIPSSKVLSMEMVFFLLSILHMCTTSCLHDLNKPPKLYTKKYYKPQVAAFSAENVFFSKWFANDNYITVIILLPLRDYIFEGCIGYGKDFIRSGWQWSMLKATASLYWRNKEYVQTAGCQKNVHVRAQIYQSFLTRGRTSVPPLKANPDGHEKGYSSPLDWLQVLWVSLWFSHKLQEKLRNGKLTTWLAKCKENISWEIC